jgi:hypothetical protein
MPLIVESEKGIAQTEPCTAMCGECGVCRKSITGFAASRIGLERPAKEGDSPVSKSSGSCFLLAEYPALTMVGEDGGKRPPRLNTS